MEPNNQIPNQPHFFNEAQTSLLYTCLGLFLISTVGTTIKPLFILTYSWFIAVLAGCILVLGSFIVGLINIKKDGGIMLSSSVILLFFLILVGYGTCIYNITAFDGFRGL